MLNLPFRRGQKFLKIYAVQMCIPNKDVYARDDSNFIVNIPKLEATRCLPTDEQIKKLQHRYKIEFYSLVKRHELQINTTSRLNLKFMPKEIGPKK